MTVPTLRVAERTAAPAPGAAPIDAVVVVVPAHDEEDLISEFLMSMSVAAAASPLVVDVVVVMDSCTDATSSIVDAYIKTDASCTWHLVSVSERRASSSRDAGVAQYLRATGQVASPTFAVLSTDADSTVPADWIAAHVAQLDGGVDAVAGTVDLSPLDDIAFASCASRTDEFAARWRLEYTSSFRADGSHDHVHAANLAVRLDALVAAGGFGDRARAEDIDLWRRLALVPGVRLRSVQSNVVTTSRRLEGRVTGGFASAIRQFRLDPT